MKHAEQLIERVLFLDGTPKMEYLELNVGGDVRAQIEADFKLEVNAVAMYNKAIQVARDAGDDQEAAGRLRLLLHQGGVRELRRPEEGLEHLRQHGQGDLRRLRPFGRAVAARRGALL